MKHLNLKLVTLFILSFGQVSFSQNLVLNTYKGESEIKATNSVTLTPGFHVPAGSAVRIYTGASFQNCVPLASSPSADQNYILSKIFKIPGVLTDAQTNQVGRSTCEVNQTVQYVDGFGRPVQNVNIQGSSTFADVVQPVSYDAFGREDKKYQPYAISSTGGTYHADALNSGAGLNAFYSASHAGIISTAYPFSQVVYEASPLNRIVEQGAPGQAWQPVSGSNTGHTIKIDYGTNTAGDAVRLWIISGTGASVLNSYAAGTLYRTTVRDENWTSADGHAGTSDEYKDLEGRIVLKRIWESDARSLSTYYVYDDFGNLAYVIPPAVNENGQANTSSFTESDNVFKQYIYGYHYDGRKRLIEKSIPGKDWEFMVYDSLDQLVMSQDGNRRSQSQWLFNKYDALGRLVLTGLYSDGSGRSALQAAYDNHSANQGALWESRDNGGAHGTGYTNVSLPTSGITEYYQISYYDDYDFYNNTFGQPNGSSQVGRGRTKSLLTGSRVKVLGSETMLLSVNYYDHEGRVIESQSQNHLGGNDIVTNTYNFAGELTASTRRHSNSAGTGNVTVANRYDYDHMGRKMATMESINNQAEIVLSRMNYTELGQPLTKSLHSTDNGSSFLENTNYIYNERGWLKSALSGNFALQLNYNDGSVPQYNGNISNQLWGQGSLTNTFTYGYDRLNRLTSAASPNLGENITYDVMGNITSLTREGYGTNTYSGYSGNLLTQIGGFINSSYDYDANGNLRTDSQKGISIAYNHLNLPISISGSANINYTYDAAGNKLRKSSDVGGTTDYVNGIQHKATGSVDIIVTEEGLARNNSGTYSYEYTLTDHLGNTRTTFYKNPSVGLEVLQRDDYFAFGLRRATQAASNENKYLYNGKELQEELGTYDYGRRQYDPIIGRFNVIDRFAEKYSHLSSYSYGANNPINLIDINGDSLWVSHAGNKILYENGGFYNKDGTTYSGKGAKLDKNGNVTGYKGFLGQALSALNSIGGTQVGSSLLNELQSSSNNFTIQNSTTNEFVVDPSQRVAGYANQLQTDPSYASQLAGTAASAMVGGAGGTINWDPRGANVWTLGGGQNNNAASNLGHELFHGQDANRGLLDGRSHQGLKYDEWQATFKENHLRSQMGLPLREYYRSQDNNGTLSPMAPRTLNGTNQPIRPSWTPGSW